jgi:molybdenum cofactor cytidylyltransferase
VTSRAAAVVLAAGSARRFGADKLSAEFHGRPVLVHVLDAAQDAGLAPIVVVVAPGRQLDVPAMQIIVNEEPSHGLSSSLRVGLAALAADKTVGRALVMLGDQPLVSAAVIGRLLAQADDRPIVVPRYSDGQPGNPVLLARAVWPLAEQLTGDRGMVQLIETRPELIGYVDVPGTNPDVDTPADLAALEA